MYKKFFVIAFLWAFGVECFSQNQIGHNWQFGIGSGLVKFSDKDASYIGDKHLAQVPRLNATKRLNEKISIDGALSFGSFDASTKFIAQNDVPYFSFDLSARYRYISTLEYLDPFVFVGGSIVDSDPNRKTTPTINIGTGVTYWFTEMFGFSTQVYYKYSLKSFESMRSHFQFTAGVVVGLNLGEGRRAGSGSSCYYNQYK